MRVLAFDTTTAACSVSVWQDGELLGTFHKPMMHGQAEALIPAIEETLAKAEMEYAMLDRIGVTVGPGSFTGVRVGLATARGLGAAIGCPVIGIPTTEVIAAEARQNTPVPIAVAIDARRAEVYLHRFDTNGHALDEPVCLLPDQAAARLDDGDWALAGDGAARIAESANKTWTCVSPTLPNAETLAQLAAAAEATDQSPRPLYVRPPDAALPKHGGRLRP